jgi:nucleoside 2-deoxyribosyltransferase
MKVYLAGPEVFLPNAREMLDRKAALARAAGFVPLSPGDPNVPPSRTVRDQGLAISAVDEQMMYEADGVIANLTPYRGISTDVGTAYEVGFMCALGKAVYAYTNVARGHLQRQIDYYGGRYTTDASGHFRGSDGLTVDNFDMMDNLMLPGGIERRGGVVVIGNAPPESVDTDTTAFEECLRIMAKKYL